MDSPLPARGRPPTPSVSEIGADGPGRVLRVAWLLRTNRLHGTSGEMSNAERFARAFHGGCASRHADRSQVSRWEKGADPAEYLTIRRYEQLLGLPEASLTSIVDHIYREIHHGGGKRLLARRPPDQTQIGDLVDMALGNDALTGLDWDILCDGLITATSRRFRKHENAVVLRLLIEQQIADGRGWQLRSAATQRLTRSNQRLTSTVIDACAAMAMDPFNEMYTEPLTILESAADPRAARHVLWVITRPVNDSARQAAWSIATEKVTRGHFTAADKQILIREAVSLLTAQAYTPARIAAADLLRRSPANTTVITPALERVLARDAIARSVLTTGRTSSRYRDLAQQLAQRASAALSSDLPGNDLMLAALIEETLLHPHMSRRVVAARMIAATPYRGPVGREFAKLLRRREIHTDPSIAVPMIYALTAFGDETSRELIEHVSAAPSSPQAIVDAALWCVSHIAHRLPGRDSFWSTWQYRAGTGIAAQTARALAYAAGIARQDHVLRSLTENPEVPAAGRRAAMWWLNIPRRIRRGVVS